MKLATTVFSISRGAVCVALALLATVRAGVACDPGNPPLLEVERPTTYSEDGSFTHAGIDRYSAENYHYFSARAAIDVGGARIAQRVSGLTGGGCGIMTEYLLFADCTASRAIMVMGAPPAGPIVIPNWGASLVIRQIQPPNGPIRITPSATVEGLERTAREVGLTFITDFDAYMSDWPRRSRFDPLRGCQIFYPELAG